MGRNRIVWERGVEHDDGSYTEEEVEIPTKYEVCHTCRGEGKHVHPDIDGNGISMEEWNGPNWDDDEREAYMSGRYDVICYECGGDRVTKVVDWDTLMVSDPKLAKEYERYLDDKHYHDQISEMERRMGA